MNKIHRVVWSKSRGTYVVAHEFATTTGKVSTTCSAIAQSLAAAALLVAAPVFSQTVTVTAPVAQKTLGSNETLVVTNTGTIASTNTAAGVTGTSVSAVAITNSGTIVGGTVTGGTPDGVELTGTTLTGGITNSGAGSLISAPSASGIGVLGGSNVSGISNDGTITGAGVTGVSVVNSTVGTITNTGTGSLISGGTTGIVVQFASVSSIVNAGSISGGENGISNSGSISSINNTGTAAQIYGGFTGVGVYNGGSLGALVNSGTISGGSYGINADDGGTITSITNSGLINGSAAGIAAVNGGSIVSILNMGSIGGSSDGIFVNGGSIGSINNSGVISGTGTAGIQVVAGSIGSIVNTGTIQGENGILIGGGAIGSINNSGLIAGVPYGIAANGGTISSIVNSGTISGNSAGVFVNGGLISSISNSGLITGEFPVEVNAGTISSFVNSGAIISSGTVAVLINSDGTVSSFANSGTISGSFAGIEVQKGTLSSFSNTGTISAGLVAFYLDEGSVGTLENSGQLGAGAGYGVVAAGTLGSLFNSGTIAGYYFGLYFFDLLNSGGITSSGLINATSYSGVLIEESSISGGITNLAGGVISGASGISVYDSSVDFISNQKGASIVGRTDGISLQGGTTISGGISNGGTITGGSYGINMTYPPSSSIGGLARTTQISGGIVNSGLISGTSVAGIAMNGATLAGGITNLAGGTISGGQFGIDISYSLQTSSGVSSTPTALSGGIVNSGLISGASVAGIAVNNVSISGGITNLKGGTISGGATGISVTNASTVTGGLSNSGVISGGTYSVYVDSTSSLGPITIGGVNSAQFIGDVYALASDVTVSAGAVFSATNAFDVNSFNVAAGATVNLANPASTAGGASGITVADGFNNAGTVSVARGVTGVINGAYTQTSSGEYRLGAASSSSYGVLAVNGTVDLPSAAKIYVDVAPNSTLTNKEVLTGVITSTGLTASTFDVTDNLDLISFTGKIDGNNVDLVTKVNALVLQDVLANGNYNAAPAAKVIDEIIATNSNGPFAPVIDELAKLQTSQQVSRTVSQFLPLLSGASNVASIGTLWELDQVIQSRLDGNTGLSSGDDYLTDRGAWVKPFGTWGNQSDQGSAPGFTSNTGGIVLGADGAVSHETRLGLAFAYASSDITGKGAEASDENKVDMYQMVGYGSYALDPVTEVNFQLDGGGNSNSGHRSIPAFGTNASSSYNSSTAHFGVGIGRSLPIDDMTMWTPSARIDYTWVRSDSYGETGAGPLNLNVQSTSAEQLLTSVDAKIVHKLNDYASVFGNVGVGYDSLARNNTQIISAFAGAPGLPFATQGVGLKPWTVLAGFGVVATPQGGPEITVRYDLQDRSSFTEQSFSVKARWAF